LRQMVLLFCSHGGSSATTVVLARSLIVVVAGTAGFTCSFMSEGLRECVCLLVCLGSFGTWSLLRGWGGGHRMAVPPLSGHAVCPRADRAPLGSRWLAAADGRRPHCGWSQYPPATVVLVASFVVARRHCLFMGDPRASGGRAGGGGEAVSMCSEM
jgi:hypothetical protein